MGGCTTKSDTYRGKSYDGRSNTYEPVFDDIKKKKSPRRNRATAKDRIKKQDEDLNGREEVDNGVLDMRRKSQFKNKNTSRIQSSKMVQNREMFPTPELIKTESEQPKLERTIVPRRNRSEISRRSNSIDSIPDLFVTRPQSPKAFRPPTKQPEFTSDAVNQKRSPEFNMVGQEPVTGIPSSTQPFMVPNQPPGISKDFNFRAQSNLGSSISHAQLMSRPRSASQISTSGNFHPITNGGINGRNGVQITMNPIGPNALPALPQHPLPPQIQQMHAIQPLTHQPPTMMNHVPYIASANMVSSQMVSSGMKSHPPIRPSSYLSASIIMSLKVEMEDDQETLDMQRFDYVRRIPF